MIGLLKDKYSESNKYIEKYIAILDANNINYVILNANDASFWDELKKINLFIFRWGHYDSDRQLASSILPVIESMNIECFPNNITGFHFDDKIIQYYLFKSKNFPYIDTSIFWDKKDALDWVNNSADYPTVFKLKGGAGATNVKLVKSKRHAVKLVNRMFGSGMKSNAIDRNKFSLLNEIKHLGGKLIRRFKGEDALETWGVEKNYILFQKFLPKNEFDVRVCVIGLKVFAFRRFNRENDFRASGSGNWDVSPDNIDIKCVKIALDICKEMKFQTMAFDFLKDTNGNWQFCEVSYTYDDYAIFKCPGYWDANLNWNKGNFWPEYVQLQYLLDREDLIQPNNIK